MKEIISETKVGDLKSRGVSALHPISKIIFDGEGDRTWYCKPIFSYDSDKPGKPKTSDMKGAEREVLAQEFRRLIMPAQPETRIFMRPLNQYTLEPLRYSSGGSGLRQASQRRPPDSTFFPHILSAESADFKSLPRNEQERFSRTGDGEIRGLGQVLVSAMMLGDTDVKISGNIGINDQNQVINIDGGWCLTERACLLMRMSSVPDYLSVEAKIGEYDAMIFVEDKLFYADRGRQELREVIIDEDTPGVKKKAFDQLKSSYSQVGDRLAQPQELLCISTLGREITEDDIAELPRPPKHLSPFNWLDYAMTGLVRADSAIVDGDLCSSPKFRSEVNQAMHKISTLSDEQITDLVKANITTSTDDQNLYIATMIARRDQITVAALKNPSYQAYLETEAVDQNTEEMARQWGSFRAHWEEMNPPLSPQEIRPKKESLSGRLSTYARAHPDYKDEAVMQERIEKAKTEADFRTIDGDFEAQQKQIQKQAEVIRLGVLLDGIDGYWHDNPEDTRIKFTSEMAIKMREELPFYDNLPDVEIYLHRIKTSINLLPEEKKLQAILNDINAMDPTLALDVQSLREQLSYVLGTEDQEGEIRVGIKKDVDKLYNRASLNAIDGLLNKLRERSDKDDPLAFFVESMRSITEDLRKENRGQKQKKPLEEPLEKRIEALQEVLRDKLAAVNEERTAAKFRAMKAELHGMTQSSERAAGNDDAASALSEEHEDPSSSQKL